MTDVLVTAVPVGTAAFLIVAACLLYREQRPAPPRPTTPIRIPAQAGPDSRTSRTPGASP